MASIYLSFLGLGSDTKDGKKGYTPALYELKGKKSLKTDFVQVAELEILGSERFDKVIIVATDKSHEANFKSLKDQLERIGAMNITYIIISEDMSARGPWKWFEKIISHIDFNDRLTVDLTHGYRAIPIVFSTAINFLQKAKNVTLDAVYYGAFDKDRKLSPIVDMKNFYIVNEWAEAVSRLVEDADARKIAASAEKSMSFQLGELNDPNLVRVLEDLTNTLRNVDVNNVSQKSKRVIQLVEEKEKSASAAGKILLHLIRDKFVPLDETTPFSGRYDADYFKIQLAIIKMLLDHKLYMQTFTVMRELIGSIGLIEDPKANIASSKGRSRRRRAEVFFNMVQYKKSEWNFEREVALACKKMMPFYEKLELIGVVSILREFASNLAWYRNCFDHAWTGVPEAPKDIKAKGDFFFGKLEETVRRLRDGDILK